MAIEKVQLMHECCSQHLRTGAASMGYDKEIEEGNM